MYKRQIDIRTPAFAKSLIEKYPAEYAITFVGVDVIKINASEDANAAGNAMANVDIPRLIDSSIIIGITILADTVAPVSYTHLDVYKRQV